METTETLNPRARLITAALDLSGAGVEYGPLDKPLVPKPPYSVSYVDYTGRSDLVNKLQSNENRDVDKIREVDIVTGGEQISNFLPDSSIDYVVASHVMEHVPDLLGWLEANLRILRPGGRIGLAFPDRRYCFDLKRKSTTLSDIIAAYIEGRTRPSFHQICDQVWNAAQVKASDVWNKKVTQEDAPYLHSRKRALEILHNRVQSDAYFDCHCWVFSDNEFLDMMHALRGQSSIDYKVVSFLPTNRGQLEFFATLERAGL